MKAQKTTQTMKPATAAKKLGIHLLAAPAEFQEGVVSRAELNALQAEPPEWLRDLRADGPHPRQVTAARLGVSIAGLARGGVTEALTTEQIDELKAQMPEWLQRERTIQAEVRREAERVKELHERQAKVAPPQSEVAPTRGKEPTRGKVVPTRSKVVPARSRARSK